MSKATSKNVGYLAVVGVIMLAVIGGGIAISKNLGKSHSEISRENAVALLDKKLKKDRRQYQAAAQGDCRDRRQ